MIGTAVFYSAITAALENVPVEWVNIASALVGAIAVGVPAYFKVQRDRAKVDAAKVEVDATKVNNETDNNSKIWLEFGQQRGRITHLETELERQRVANHGLRDKLHQADLQIVWLKLNINQLCKELHREEMFKDLLDGAHAQVEAVQAAEVK